jgi:hypothetical protein
VAATTAAPATTNSQTWSALPPDATTNLSKPATTPPPPPPVPPPPEEENSGPNIVKWVIISLVVLALTIVLGLIVAILGAVSDSAGVANFFRILRDFFIVVLALQGTLICIALIVLILQISALISLVRTEIKPIVDETRQTMSTIRGTAQFVSKNVASPIIRTSAIVSGAATFLRELSGLRRNLGSGKKGSR